jgi:hypothetical protein
VCVTFCILQVTARSEYDKTIGEYDRTIAQADTASKGLSTGARDIVRNDLCDKREEINRQILKENDEKSKVRRQTSASLFVLDSGEPCVCSRVAWTVALTRGLDADPERPGCAHQAHISPERLHRPQSALSTALLIRWTPLLT